jgi:NADH-ubiquinone oxidoreductase chain 5
VRSSFIFEYSNILLFIITIFGGFTALFTGLIAVYQYDIKKIIAYSTCSQLGYMFFCSGLSNYNLTLFHLFNHAFFKALLFLGAGSIISALLDEQDYRKMGSLVYKMPFTYLSIFIGSMAIIGFPFLTGFYSKDFILESTITSYCIDSIFIYFLGVFSAFFTAIYSFRLIFFIFLIKTNIYKKDIHIEENNVSILIPLFILSIMSIITGYFFSDIFIGIGNNYLISSIYIKFIHFNYIDIEFLNPLKKNIPFFLTIIGIVFTKFLINYKNKNFYFYFYNLKKNFYKFFFNGAYFNFFYNKILILLIKIFYIINIKYIEKGFLELYGPVGLYIKFRELSFKSRILTSNYIFITLFFMFVLLIFVLFLIYLNYILNLELLYILLFIYYIIIK